MPFLSHQDRNLYFEFLDNQKPQTIIFSNSLGADISMWQKQVALLHPYFNILRYDTRGHGKSESSAEAFTVADLGNDIITLLNHLLLDKVIFCGLSMGGLIGQWLGIHHGSRFSHIVLANTSAKIGNENSWNDRIQYVSISGLKSIVQGTAERWFTLDFRNEEKEQVNNILATFQQTDLEGYKHCCAVVRDADFHDQIQHISVPTLIISGLHDGVTTPEDGRFLQRNIPNSNHVILYAGHLSSVEQGAEFAKAIFSFATL